MIEHRLLEIAITEFGGKGLAGASTRGIAAAAGTAMSSITYHYGSKEGLYLAAADYIGTKLGDDLPIIIEQDGATVCMTDQAARALIHEIVSCLIVTMAAEQKVSWSMFIAREQMQPTEAFERIYQGLMRNVLGRLIDSISIATGCRDIPKVKLSVFMILGQIIALRASRAMLLKLIDRDAVDTSALSSIKECILANVDAILDRLAGDETF